MKYTQPRELIKTRSKARESRLVLSCFWLDDEVARVFFSQSFRAIVQSQNKCEYPLTLKWKALYLVPRLIWRFCFQTGRRERERRPGIKTGKWTGSKSRRHHGRIVNQPSEEIRQLWASTENLIAFFLLFVSPKEVFQSIILSPNFFLTASELSD